MALVLILAVQGGVRLSFDYLQVISVGAMRSRVGHMVEVVLVARWSGDRCGGGIRAAPPACSTSSGVVGPWWASVGLRTRERTSARLGR
jgi:hypothetical protein